MNNWLTPLLIIISVIIIFGPIVLRKIISDKLTDLLIKKDFRTFDQKIESRLVKLVISPFNIDYMKLNEALIKDDHKEVDKAFKVFDSRKLNDRQKEAVYYNGFYYYLAKENKDMTTKYVDRLLKLDHLKDDVKKEIKISYDINILGHYDLLDETLKKLETEKDPQLIIKYELMIAKMYANKGEDDKAKEYMDRFLNDEKNI